MDMVTNFPLANMTDIVVLDPRTCKLDFHAPVFVAFLTIDIKQDGPISALVAALFQQQESIIQPHCIQMDTR